MRIALFPTLLLSACAVEPLPAPSGPAADVPVPPEAVAACQMEPAQRYVGQAFVPSLPEGARIASGSRSVRVVEPGQAVTMDFRPDRLTITLDAQRRVSGVRCG